MIQFLPLISVNLRRKKTRTILTIGSFSVALFLFGLLATIDDAFHQGIEVAGVDRLIVRNKISLIQPLPVSYQARLLQIPGVQHASYSSWFGGVYQDERNFFPQIAIEDESYLILFPEFIIPADQLKQFSEDRQGAIVGRTLADRFGWQIGERIPIQGTIFQGVWEFNICGIYDGARKTDDTSQFWFHHEYLDSRREWGKGEVGWYVVKVANADDAVLISRQIDDTFANSPYETTTETEKAFASGFMKQFGNIKLIILSVGAVVFFTLLLITGSNMAISVRERTNEIAVLKTLGFSNYLVLVLILAESLTYSLSGGLLGLGLCKLYTLRGDPTHGMLPFFFLSNQNIILGVAVAGSVGIASGIIPAMLAMRLKIVDAIRSL